MLPTNNNPPTSRVQRSASESSDEGKKPSFPVTGLSNTSTSAQTGGASGGPEPEPGPPKVPGFVAELKGALTRKQSETEDDAAPLPPPTKLEKIALERGKVTRQVEFKMAAEAEASGGPEERGASGPLLPPKTAHRFPSAITAEMTKLMKDVETGGASGSSYSRPASPTQREEAAFPPEEPFPGPSTEARSSLRFDLDPQKQARKEVCMDAANTLGRFLAAPTEGNLKGLMLSAINVLDTHGPRDSTARQYFNMLNSCLRDVPSDSPVKGIIQDHIGLLWEFGNSVATLKGAFQGILDNLISKGH